MFRLILAIILGKIIFAVSRVLNIGGGSAAPGYYALKIEPELVSKLSKKIPTNIIITGTNGKTTTSRLLNHLVTSQKIRTIRNSTGSNLERGIASALISKANMLGNLNGYDLGIWETDEAAFNTLLPKLRPQIIVILNIFRDQLDRYGEINSIIKKWWNSLYDIDFKPILITNLNDSNIGYFSNHENVSGQTFILKNHVIFQESTATIKEKNEDKIDFESKLIKNNGLKGTIFSVKFDQKELKVELPIPGIYHIYDFLAAFAVYYNLNLEPKNIADVLKGFKPAFGRVEEIKLGQKTGFIFLIKNPAGANSVFETINPELKSGDSILIALNDNFADGTDVSWIWDADFEFLLGDKSIKEEIGNHFDYKMPRRTKPLNLDLKDNKQKDIKVMISGKRAADMALRLKYAGFKDIKVITELEEALNKCEEQKEGRIFIMPTYTAMLEMQKILTQKGIKQHYWKE